MISTFGAFDGFVAGAGAPGGWFQPPPGCEPGWFQPAGCGASGPEGEEGGGGWVTVSSWSVRGLDADEERCRPATTGTG